MKLSPSKIKRYQICPLSYDWIYNKKFITLETVALVLGSRYHEIVRQYYIDKKEHRDKVWIEYELLWCYLKNPIKWNIVDTEKRISFNVWEHLVRIILDRIDEDKLIDYKTSSFDYKQEDCKNIQSLLYVYYYWMTTWKIYPFIFHIVNKKKYKQKKYLPQIMKPVIYTVEELEQVPEILTDYVRRIESGKFPATPSWFCWWCPFWPLWLDSCPYYKSELYKKKPKVLKKK